MHQVAAIEEGNNSNALGKDVVVDLPDLFLDAFEHRVCVRALAEQNRAFHYIRIVDQPPFVVSVGLGDLAQPYLGSLVDFRNILDADWCSAGCLDQGIFNLLDIFIKALCLHIDLLRACDDEASTGIGVVVLELLLDLGNAEAVANQLLRIEPDLIFLCDSTKAGDVDNTGNIFELLLENPVFKRLLLHDVDIRILALNGVPVNLPAGLQSVCSCGTRFAGRVMPDSLSRTLSRFQLLSEESLKFIMMLDMPARLKERRFFMSGIPAMAISHGTVICFSMSSAE